ncbi:hypothetical protein BCV71DRAFT_237562 [Rhizopus microsporus]|uniref:Uncharacterized protein n=1 Tax=Rhizopus microsporus TaxID=58291 RepID=A0A1X0RTS8_RHIZD|nr:hypothetical protein BCV71DRAFT_237562 [Rhizopus microsporus]
MTVVSPGHMLSIIERDCIEILEHTIIALLKMEQVMHNQKRITTKMTQTSGEDQVESKIEMAMPAKRRQRMQLGPPAARYSLVFYAIYILLCMHLVWGNLGSLSES